MNEITLSTLYFVNHPPVSPEGKKFGGYIYLLRRGCDVGYVGQTRRRPEERLSGHLRSARSGSDLPVHRWIRADPAGVVMEIVEVVDSNSPRNIDVAERSIIAGLRAAGCHLHNVASGGCGFPEHTPETRAKIGAKSKGRKLSPEARAKLSVAMRGRKLTDEHRAKISERMRENPPFLGRKHSPETLEKQRAVKLGKKMTAEARANMSAVRKGRRFTEEHRANLAAAARRAGKLRRGIPLAEETKAKIAAANTGKHHTEETKAKIGAAHRGRKLSPEHVAKTRRTGSKHSEEARAKMRAAAARRKILQGE